MRYIIKVIESQEETFHDVLKGLLPAWVRNGFKNNNTAKAEEAKVKELINRSFARKNEDYYSALADAIRCSESLDGKAVLVSNAKEKDIRKAVTMAESTYGIKCKLPLLWSKIQLLKACREMAQDEYFTAMKYFKELYRGKSDGSDDLFLEMNMPKDQLEELVRYIKGESEDN